MVKCSICKTKEVVVSWTPKGFLCCQCRNKTYPKIKKYPSPCGQHNEPGHRDHNCNKCKNNLTGCPENCKYGNCYAGSVCHFEREK